MSHEDLFDSDPTEELAETLEAETRNLQRRMKEIEDQKKQFERSLDRERKNYAHISSELRNIDANLDGTPREDIKAKYEEALEARLRLTTMQAQSEVMDNNYKYLQEKLDFINQVFSFLDGVQLSNSSTSNANRKQSLDVISIIQAQEDERKRLARQMHDGPAQSLTNFIIQADICRRLFDRNPERAGEELDALKTNASTTFQKVRDFIFDLRPMMLDDLGVVPTVKRYIETMEEKQGMNIKLNIIGEDRRLEPHVEVMIFRSVQDLYAIARDTASPNHIKVFLDVSNDPVQISVEDDGTGFDVTPLFTDGDNKIVENDARIQALAMLKSKIETLNGDFSAQSSEESGTIIRIEIPIGA
ncbi:sensor histidine kinase [Anaerolineales bacterium]